MNHFIVDGRYKELFANYGLDVGQVLKKARLSEDLFNHKTLTMKEEEYYRFLSAVDSMAADPKLPVRMATASQIESFSPPIFASYCSKNGSVCIERLSRYKKLIGPMTFLVTKEGEKEKVELLPGDPTLELPTFLVVSEFAFLVGMIRHATQEDIRPVEVTMKELPGEQAFAEFAGIVPKQGEKNEIVFTCRDLEEPFISHNEALWSYFEPELTKRLAELDVDDSIGARVRSALTELLPGGFFGIEDVAEKLGLTKRTLQRKLSEEGTTFQKQLNGTRELLSLHYIRDTDMAANDIAYLLGYAELNSFLRAFKIWTGKSIAEYRKADGRTGEKTEGKTGGQTDG